MRYHFNDILNRLEITASNGHVIAFVEARWLGDYPYFERLSNEIIF